MNSVKKVLLALLAISSLTALNARTFYLSPTGTDSDQGGTTQQSPWKTITYATAKMGAGDTLLLAGGTYTTETKIEIKNGGSAAERLVIRAMPGQKPAIDLGYYKPVADLPKVDPDDTFRLTSGQPGRTVANEDPNRFILISVSNVLLEGLTIQGAHTAIWAAYWNGTGSGLEIRDCTIRYNEIYALRLDNFNNVRMTGCTVYHCGLENWPRSESKKWPHAIIGWSADSVIIDSCAIHNNHGEGPGPFMWCSTWQIRNCQVYDNWSVNIYLDSDEDNHVVDGNLVYNTGRYGTSGRNMPDGIRVANELADLDYSEYGIEPDPTPGVAMCTITNNIIINTGGGIRAFPYDPRKSFYLRNSLIANNTIVDIPLSYHSIEIVGDNVEIANNLIVNCPKDNAFYNVGAGVNAHTNLLTQDGGFVNGTGYDASSYKLHSTSSAVNAGVSIPVVSVDFWGTPRPQETAYDIGATEYAPSTSIFVPANLQGVRPTYSSGTFDLAGRYVRKQKGLSPKHSASITVYMHHRLLYLNYNNLFNINN